MIDDGNRLSFSIRGNNVTVTNNLDGTVFVKSQLQNYPVMTMDKTVLFNHIQTLQQLIASNTLRTFCYRPFTRATNDGTIKVVECDHYSYRFIVDGKCAELTEVSFRGQRGFNAAKLNNALGFVYSVATMSTQLLQPKRDIIRRIADLGILVWCYDGHTLVCKETNINGCTLLNCLIDDDVYNLVYVSINTNDNRCYIFDSNLTEILSVPIDQSVLTYFSDDSEGF